MAVYTQLSEHSLRQLLAAYRLGDLRHFTGVKQGVTNTNYFVATDRDEYFLTIFEELTIGELPSFINLTHQLANAGIPCPKTMQTQTGESIIVWQNKPVVIAERLAGKTINQPNIKQCEQVGQALAKMHLAGEKIYIHHSNTRDVHWHEKTAELVMLKLAIDEKKLLSEELSLLKKTQLEHLPSGIIHADLFRDNVLFVDNELSGIIDFYYAYHGPWLYDLAVTYNDWCVKQTSFIEEQFGQVLINAYQAIRPLTADELEMWPVCLRLASLRFWLSRLYDYHFSVHGEHLNIKNPDEFKKLSLFHRQ